MSPTILLTPAAADAKAEDCGLPAVAISRIQGAGFESPLDGERVEVEAVVSLDLRDNARRIGGFYLLEDAQEQDGDEATSEGIFVYYRTQSPPLLAGDRVRLRASVREYRGLTELVRVNDLSRCSGGERPKPLVLREPLSGNVRWEALEGMPVRFEFPLTVTELGDLNVYGEIGLSPHGRAFAPTRRMSPGLEAAERQRELRRGFLLLDDASHRKYPRPLPFAGKVRVGDRLDTLTAVVTEGFGDYRLLPLGKVQLTRLNPRPPAPAKAAAHRLRIAAFNLQNHFNGVDGDFSVSRGAASRAALQRQRAKLVAALHGLDADIVGLMELENDGSGPQSAASELLDACNAELPPEGRYRRVSPPGELLGSDAIRVGLWYRPARVRLMAEPLVLDGEHLRDRYNRPILVQRFQAGDRPFEVAVNHWKSKGSDCEAVDDPDRGDGQGDCNLTRVAAADALLAWRRTEASALIVIGDLNAHAAEDPVRRLSDAGLEDLLRRLPDSQAYSDRFRGLSGYLMHALADPGIADRVREVGIWHINADEPDWYGYAARLGGYQPNAYRSSDHDPVWIDLEP